ncbi:MAG: hypothetical protein WAZ77_09910 [Candidatus Nitrosopolaris sp.]
MNHKALAIVPIVAVAALELTAVGFAIPQQAFAWGHSHNHHNHNRNSIKVDQQINQQNECTGVQDQLDQRALEGNGMETDGSSGTVCVNQGDNSADIHK